MNDVDKDFRAWWDSEEGPMGCQPGSVAYAVASMAFRAARAPSPPAPQDVGTRMAEKLVEDEAMLVRFKHPSDPCGVYYLRAPLRRTAASTATLLRTYIAAAINAAVREEAENCAKVAERYFEGQHAAIAIRDRHPKERP